MSVYYLLKQIKARLMCQVENASGAMAKFLRTGVLFTEVLEKICSVLDCKVWDIAEVISEDGGQNE